MYSSKRVEVLHEWVQRRFDPLVALAHVQPDDRRRLVAPADALAQRGLRLTHLGVRPQQRREHRRQRVVVAASAVEDLIGAQRRVRRAAVAARHGLEVGLDALAVGRPQPHRVGLLDEHRLAQQREPPGVAEQVAKVRAPAAPQAPKAARLLAGVSLVEGDDVGRAVRRLAAHRATAGCRIRGRARVWRSWLATLGARSRPSSSSCGGTSAAEQRARDHASCDGARRWHSVAR